jgi:hypothetical protein
MCKTSLATNPIQALNKLLCDTSCLANRFPMYEHVGVDEEGMYGVEVVDITIPTNYIVVERVYLSKEVIEKKRAVKRREW